MLKLAKMVVTFHPLFIICIIHLASESFHSGPTPLRPCHIWTGSQDDVDSEKLCFT